MAIPCQLYHGRPYVDLTKALGYISHDCCKDTLAHLGKQGPSDQNKEIETNQFSQNTSVTGLKIQDVRSISVFSSSEDDTCQFLDSGKDLLGNSNHATTKIITEEEKETLNQNEKVEADQTIDSSVESNVHVILPDVDNSYSKDIESDNPKKKGELLSKAFDCKIGEAVFSNVEQQNTISSQTEKNVVMEDHEAFLEESSTLQNQQKIHISEKRDRNESPLGGEHDTLPLAGIDARENDSKVSETSLELDEELVHSLTKEYGLNISPIYDNTTQDLALEAFLLLLFTCTDEKTLPFEQRDIYRQVVCEMCQVYAQYVATAQDTYCSSGLQIPVGYSAKACKSPPPAPEKPRPKLAVKLKPKGLTKSGKRRGRPPKVKNQETTKSRQIGLYDFETTQADVRPTRNSVRRHSSPALKTPVNQIEKEDIILETAPSSGEENEQWATKDDDCDDAKDPDYKPKKKYVPKQKQKDTDDLFLGKELIFTCTSCGKVFGKRETLMRHRRVLCLVKPSKAAGPLACDVCGKIFPRKKNLQKHRRRHFGKKQYKCRRCDTQFQSWDELVEHRGSHGKRLFKCSLCDKLLASKHSLEVHERTHTDERPFRCEQCGKSYRQQSSLLSHVLSHTGVKNFICEICGKMFADGVSLKQHSVIHREKKPFQCKECGKGFNNSSNMQKHMWHHTGEKPHKCEICNLGFLKLDRLNAHMCSHTGEMPYTCATCGKQFAHIRYLKRHELTHTDVRPYQCTICEKAFRREHHLKVHMRRHNGIRPYACSHCNRRFTEKHDCNRHELLHLGIKPYQCVVCQKQFSEVRILRKHIKATHGDAYANSTEIMFQNVAQTGTANANTAATSLQAVPDGSPSTAMLSNIPQATLTSEELGQGQGLHEGRMVPSSTTVPLSMLFPVSQGSGEEAAANSGKVFQCQGCLLGFETMSDLTYHTQLCPKIQVLSAMQGVNYVTW
ncbi:zinc finger protein 37-like [Lingula anatina]|uniref:Zinc finger protein 37-like n=1 Tax=Lingula anatina TaxID=7574 RepID=A0A2R2MSG4_LINAN|nr:zinc finger protein 37-like [Lingula anatina]|eukprot:XP_023932937.1 zinc finger protein 37-like [Lingula anatina]